MKEGVSKFNFEIKHLFCLIYFAIQLSNLVYAAKQTLFMIEKSFPCATEQELPIHLHNWSASSKANIVTLNGVSEITEVLKGPISLELNVQRCTIQRTRCDMFPPVSLPDICNSLNTKFMGPNFLTRVKPKLHCPIKPNNYSFEDVQLDLKEFTKIPFEEARLKPTFKFFVTKKQKRILAGCLATNVRLSISSVRKN